MPEAPYEALQEALRAQAGLSPRQSASMLSGVRLQPKALRLAFPPDPIQGAPEAKAPAPPPGLSALAERAVRPDSLAQGRAFVQEHLLAIQSTARQFQVSPGVLVGIIGTETRFGRIQGDFPTLDTLATLGFQGPRRQEFFLGELVALVQLGQRLGRQPDDFLGSFAGALGIPQFMPSSYLKFARTADGTDRPADLFRRVDDALASVANFLVEHGWQPQAPVALPVQGLDPTWEHLEVKGLRPEHTLADLLAAGAVDPAHAKGFEPSTPMSLVRLSEGADPPTLWAAGAGFFAITHYNRSYRYAASVLALAAGLRSPRLKAPTWAGSRSVPPLLQS